MQSGPLDWATGVAASTGSLDVLEAATTECAKRSTGAVYWPRVTWVAIFRTAARPWGIRNPDHTPEQGSTFLDDTWTGSGVPKQRPNQLTRLRFVLEDGQGRPIPQPGPLYSQSHLDGRT